MNNSNTAPYADIFAALGSEPRLEIMRLLFAAYPHGLTVGEIQSQLDIPNSTLSHHLEKLRVENLVSSRRHKQFLWYSANASTVEELLSFLYNGCSVSDSAPEREENYAAAIPEAEQLTESSQVATRNRFMFDEFLSLVQSFFSGIFDKFYLPRDFERFTPKAMQSLALAQNESRCLEHAYIGTEQLLLGLLEEGTGLAAQVMVRVGINAQDARREVEKVIGRGKGTPTDIPFTPRAKRTLELAVAQARQLEHDHVGTEHLLLGILQEGQGLGVRVLENLAIEPKNLEQQLRRTMNL